VRAEYDFSRARRGQYWRRYREGVTVQEWSFSPSPHPPQPDLCAFFVSLGVRWGYRTKTHGGIPVRRPRFILGTVADT
jgi:hypothetical protein